MKSFINSLKSKLSRKSAFEKKYGVPLDHFLEEDENGVVFNMKDFTEFVKENGGNHLDLMEAMSFIQRKRLDQTG